MSGKLWNQQTTSMEEVTVTALLLGTYYSYCTDGQPFSLDFKEPLFRHPFHRHPFLSIVPLLLMLFWQRHSPLFVCEEELHGLSLSLSMSISLFLSLSLGRGC